MSDSAFCRDCLRQFSATERCPECGSPRVLTHPELNTLTIAHMDCDAFFASVEKRDNPDLRDKPVIIGGGKRGVVSTACYIARIKGVRSAMPMFQALKLCPEAEVVKPRMSVYVEVSKQIKAMMQELTPAVEPLSLDEAFLDLTGTENLHHAPPALQMARMVRRMESDLGVSGSVGLSHNKFLAKVASDLDKPRGFSIIGKAETGDFLKGKPVNLIWGVGKVFDKKLQSKGIRTFDDLLRWERGDLAKQFGTMGERLWHLARGLDYRHVVARTPMKSISNETTFFEDTSSLDTLDGYLWRLTEKVSDRAKTKAVTGWVVSLKLKRSDHSNISRRMKLDRPTQVADAIYTTAKAMLRAEIGKGPFRLIGVGLAQIVAQNDTDFTDDFLNEEAGRREKAERASDKIRAKFGDSAILKGRALR